MRGEDGRLHSDTALGRGEASLWMVEFRGESTATMVYDGRPVVDHFKAVDDRTLVGIMNGKGFARTVPSTTSPRPGTSGTAPIRPTETEAPS